MFVNIKCIHLCSLVLAHLQHRWEGVVVVGRNFDHWSLPIQDGAEVALIWQKTLEKKKKMIYRKLWSVEFDRLSGKITNYLLESKQGGNPDKFYWEQQLGKKFFSTKILIIFVLFTSFWFAVNLWRLLLLLSIYMASF